MRSPATQAAPGRSLAGAPSLARRRRDPTGHAGRAWPFARWRSLTRPQTTRPNRPRRPRLAVRSLALPHSPADDATQPATQAAPGRSLAGAPSLARRRRDPTGHAGRAWPFARWRSLTRPQTTRPNRPRRPRLAVRSLALPHSPADDATQPATQAAPGRSLAGAPSLARRRRDPTGHAGRAWPFARWRSLTRPQTTRPNRPRRPRLAVRSLALPHSPADDATQPATQATPGRSLAGAPSLARRRRDPTGHAGHAWPFARWRSLTRPQKTRPNRPRRPRLAVRSLALPHSPAEDATQPATQATPGRSLAGAPSLARRRRDPTGHAG